MITIILFFTVLQRCFPDFTTKNGTLTVGNKTTFEDGNGKTRNAIELRTAAKYVYILIFSLDASYYCTQTKASLG